jgi:hypothetical protein
LNTETLDGLWPIQVPGFFAVNRHRLNDRDWLRRAVWPACRNLRCGWEGGHIKVVQHPQELAWFLRFMAERQVKSYLEIGVAYGGSLCIVHSYLSAAVPGYALSVGCDRADSTSHEWKEFAAAQGARLQFKRQSSASIQLNGDRFDLALVDANHREWAVLRDYDKVKNNSRMVAFHDIAAKKGWVKRAWDKIIIGKPHRQFINRRRRLAWMMGIGVMKP